METIPAIESSLDELENVLEPLLETDLSETASKLDTLQKAKFQVILSHAVHSLVASATRFIKHAIQEAGKQGNNHIRFNTTAEVSMKTVVTTSGVNPQSSIISAELTSAALAKIEERRKALAESDDLEPDDELMVVDEVVISKSEGKRKQNQEDTDTSNSKKKKRKGIDPWTGFEDLTTTVVTQKGTEANKTHDVSTPIASKPPRKPRHKKKKQQQVNDAESGSNGDNSQTPIAKAKTTAKQPDYHCLSGGIIRL
ncbi:hypothetical protein Clacol_004261 [Clathrus columnatus]|uniref:Uncharacterized protein n=1 Tax=Clathrus columnatus TaxID=1419009 RepID=A0AAV5A6X6_9AGAM|nr:hypothetical protein Clacol_004261 [Clathrus columnatus]